MGSRQRHPEANGCTSLTIKFECLGPLKDFLVQVQCLTEDRATLVSFIERPTASAQRPVTNSYYYPWRQT